MLLQVLHGAHGPDTRAIRRNHVWRHPSEGVVAGILGEDITESILRASVNLHIPVQISAIPQVYAIEGMLVPTAMGAGFSSLGDIISKGSVAANNELALFAKSGATGVVGVTSSLWRLGSLPAAGSVGAALPGGTETGRTTTGALGQANATSGYTKHIVGAYAVASVAGQCLLLHDRIWHGAPAMNNSSAQTVTISGGINRYSTTGASGTSRGNTAWMEVGGTALAATAHNHTLTYVDDNGNTAEAAAAFAGVSSAITDRFDHAGTFWPLNAGDVGISNITQYQCSALVATGVMNLVLAHPLLFIPCLAANVPTMIDGINSDINLEQVYDDACLAFVEVSKSATTATTYQGGVRFIQGNS